MTQPFFSDLLQQQQYFGLAQFGMVSAYVNRDFSNSPRLLRVYQMNVQNIDLLISFCGVDDASCTRAIYTYIISPMTTWRFVHRSATLIKIIIVDYV